jgi:hypothetical protein
MSHVEHTTGIEEEVGHDKRQTHRGNEGKGGHGITNGPPLLQCPTQSRTTLQVLEIQLAQKRLAEGAEHPRPALCADYAAVRVDSTQGTSLLGCRPTSVP